MRRYRIAINIEFGGGSYVARGVYRASHNDNLADQTGQFVYTVEAPVLEGEAVTTNNQRSFALKVIRDRVRVLMVVGRPS